MKRYCLLGLYGRYNRNIINKRSFSLSKYLWNTNSFVFFNKQIPQIKNEEHFEDLYFKIIVSNELLKSEKKALYNSLVLNIFRDKKLKRNETTLNVLFNCFKILIKNHQELPNTFNKIEKMQLINKFLKLNYRNERDYYCWEFYGDICKIEPSLLKDKKLEKDIQFFLNLLIKKLIENEKEFGEDNFSKVLRIFRDNNELFSENFLINTEEVEEIFKEYLINQCLKKNEINLLFDFYDGEKKAKEIIKIVFNEKLGTKTYNDEFQVKTIQFLLNKKNRLKIEQNLDTSDCKKLLEFFIEIRRRQKTPKISIEKIHDKNNYLEEEFYRLQEVIDLNKFDIEDSDGSKSIREKLLIYYGFFNQRKTDKYLYRYEKYSKLEFIDEIEVKNNNLSYFKSLVYSYLFESTKDKENLINNFIYKYINGKDINNDGDERFNIRLVKCLIFYKSINNFNDSIDIYNKYIKEAETLDRKNIADVNMGLVSYCYHIVESIMVSSYYNLDREISKFIYNGSIKYKLVKAESTEDLRLKQLLKDFSSCYNSERLKSGSETEYDKEKIKKYLREHLVLDFLLDL
ncbi:uncharacterized protein ASCRUDRAFT_144742 [Ascoidea rubescens DSM 1968]|uniref:Uncharacterized protein n=1 Tax=Ascoidea rubescens DSM 1968 TaxID=1344418 RepID=A0A1D2VH13_9ASCO|nr:hypothetical protein ASCRUDRAFT_144742 [Ascoidea rubescens DSM 1968]ODV60944.1 hypothetical protein ASCRUDRAFT_144742 [Ascoidea rubescens DSM 1968]